MAHDALKEARAKYEAGDVVAARRLARSLGGPEAAELLTRTAPPLWAWRYALAAALSLAVMLALAIIRG